MHATMDLSKSEKAKGVLEMSVYLSSERVMCRRFVREMANYFAKLGYSTVNVMRASEIEAAEKAARESGRIVSAYEDGFITTTEAVEQLVKIFNL